MQQWDEIFKKSGRVFTKVHEDMPKVVKMFKKRDVERVLDLGCGSGRHTVYLAKRDFDVHGFDIAKEGVKIARDWLKKENLKAHLKVGDIYRTLPYKDNFFDAIISTQALHHERIEVIRELIKEMERILKPKGFIFVTVTKKRSKKEIPKEWRWKIRMIAPRTFIPLDGEEKGLIHYWFNKKILRKEFKNCRIHDIWVDSTHHYALLGELKTEIPEVEG